MSARKANIDKTSRKLSLFLLLFASSLLIGVLPIWKNQYGGFDFIWNLAKSGNDMLMLGLFLPLLVFVILIAVGLFYLSKAGKEDKEDTFSISKDCKISFILLIVAYAFVSVFEGLFQQWICMAVTIFFFLFSFLAFLMRKKLFE